MRGRASGSSGVLRRAERSLHMLRHVPPRQLLRRAQLRLAERVEPWRSPEGVGEVCWQDTFPSPPFAARADLARRQGDLLSVRVSWGWRDFPWLPHWRPEPPLRESDSSDFARLHYMEFMESLPDADVLRLIGAWIEENPRRRRDALRFSWRPYNLSVRTAAWLQELARRPWMTAPPGGRKLAASLAEQLWLLERYLETDILGNHIIRNLRALLWGSAMLKGEAPARWRRRAARLLAAEIEEQVLPDGMHYERSPSYHCQVTADLLDCHAVLAAGPLRERLEERIRAMMRVLRCFTHPDGKVALFNDGSLTMARFPAELEAAASALPGPSADPPTGAFSLPHAGYFGWRDEGELFLIDCGPLGPDHLIGHGHCDMLSFEWSKGGRRLIVDPGTYQYLAGERRLLSRTTASHNTLAIEGAEQSDIYGAFRCGRRARAELLRFETSGEGFTFQGRHDGYRSLPGSPLHERTVERQARGSYRIHDRLTADPGRPASLGLLLHPDCSVERLAAERVRVRHPPAEVEILSDAPIEIEEARWYPDLYLEVPTRRLRIRMNPPQPRSIELRPLFP